MATFKEPIRIIGIESSPYSVKVRAYCRYRHIPYRWVSRMPQFFAETRNLKPVLMPVVQYPDGSYHIDSTRIIDALERRCDPSGSIYPEDLALKFLSHLIEDFADEWLAKCIFHYRFSYDADRDFGPRWVVDDTYPRISVSELDAYHQQFLARQTARMPIVGCVPAHRVLIEESYRRLLTLLEPFVALEKFLFGTRPSLADFGLFGVLNTLSTDPTPRQVMRQLAPRVDMWTMRMDDLSGVDGHFVAFDDMDPIIESLLSLIGKIYLPYLAANKSAYDRNETTFSTTLNDHPYEQATFKYQAKCFEWLRAEFNALEQPDRDKLQTVLQPSNCWAYFNND